MRHTTGLRAGLATGAVVAAAGFGGMAAAGAATSKSHSASAGPSAGYLPEHGGHWGGPGRAPVHVEAVVLNRAGTAFVTLTSDEGTVKSVSGNDVTITEGTKTVIYKDATITVADGATVRRNGKTAALSDLTAGDRVHITQSSDGTVADAHDASFKPHFGPFGGDGPGGHGPGGDPRPPMGATGTTGSTTP